MTAALDRCVDVIEAGGEPPVGVTTSTVSEQS
jgi:hypothetical protein